MNSRPSAAALSENDADALLSGRALASHDDLRSIVGLMQMTSAVPPPRPSAALAAVLQNGFDPLPVAPAIRGSSWARWSMRIAAVTTAAMTAILGAATANALPAPFQTAVANVVDAVTPLQLPRPVADAESSGNDSGGADDQPVDVRHPDDEADARSAQPTEGTPDASGPGAPSRGARTTAPATQQVEGFEADADEPEADQRDSDEPDSDVPDNDETDADAPVSDMPGSDAPDADEPETDVPDSDETDADAPETETSDAGALDANDSDAGDDDVPDSDRAAIHLSPEPDQDDAATED